MPMLKVGDTAPDFRGTDQNGKTVTLDDLVKESAVVLYFYPKDFTPVCTAEACLFRDAGTELAEAGLRVVGVSSDDGESHKKFAAKHQINFPLLSDGDRAIQKAYEARQVLGFIPKRVTYVIDQNKKIRGAVHSELSAEKHLAAVREAFETVRS